MGRERNFQPVATDQGICMAANSLPMTRFFKENNAYKELFEEAFREDIVDQENYIDPKTRISFIPSFCSLKAINHAASEIPQKYNKFNIQTKKCLWALFRS